MSVPITEDLAGFVRYEIAILDPSGNIVRIIPATFDENNIYFQIDQEETIGILGYDTLAPSVPTVTAPSTGVGNGDQAFMLIAALALLVGSITLRIKRQKRSTL